MLYTVYVYPCLQISSIEKKQPQRDSASKGVSLLGFSCVDVFRRNASCEHHLPIGQKRF